MKNDIELGFTGLMMTGNSPEVAWQTLRDRAANPLVRKMIERMRSTEEGQKALEYSRREWAGQGLPVPWDPPADSGCLQLGPFHY